MPRFETDGRIILTLGDEPLLDAMAAVLDRIDARLAAEAEQQQSSQPDTPPEE